MSSITDELFNSLQTVTRPGDFYAIGKLDIFLPQLTVAGVGRIALPLLPMQAEQLVASAEQAPYGRGQETLVDPEVRRTWQINADRVTLDGKYWQDTLHAIVSRCTANLGVSGEVEAQLYKLLVYDTGCFFVSHRDTEKSPGMFATLVIVLPSDYQGGELVVKHQQQIATLDLSCDDASEIAYAAFYADCVHEVLPITQGCRLTLIYNLVRTNKTLPLPKPPEYHQEQALVTTLLRNWTDSLHSGTNKEIPKKLIYLLEHAYTPAELGFDHLKSADAAVADVLVAAAEQADCAIHLALVTIEESGSAEHSGGYGRRRYWDDEEEDEDFEIGEVFDRTEIISEWRQFDGKDSLLPDLPFYEYEICPSTAYEQMKSDSIEFQEATGNAGASFERTYSSAALVIWSKTFYLAIISQAGMAVNLPLLEAYCQRWEEEGQPANSPVWQDAHTLASHLLHQCVQEKAYENQHSSRQFLECLYRLRDEQCINDYWLAIAVGDLPFKENCALLARVSTLMAWSRLVVCLQQAISLTATKNQEVCASLLAEVCAVYPDTAKELDPVAQILLAALPGDPAHFPGLEPWVISRMTASSQLVVDVLNSFSTIDTALAKNALQYFFAWSAVYTLDKVLVPAALVLTQAESSRDLAVVKQLCVAAITHINTRVAMTLEPPTDWRRDNQLRCTCQDCSELRVFLDNPDQATWQFKAAEARRAHIEQSIKTHQCDLDCRTDTTKRPYTLVCTKNQASYHRRVDQRKADLAMLKTLGAIR